MRTCSRMLAFQVLTTIGALTLVVSNVDAQQQVTPGQAISTGATVPPPPPPAGTPAQPDPNDTKLNKVENLVTASQSALDGGSVASARTNIREAVSQLEEVDNATKSSASDASIRKRIEKLRKIVNDQKVAVENAQRGCNGARWCLFGGAFLAGYSITTSALGPRRGESGHQIVSLLVPTGGIRWAFHESISFDISVYSGLISTEFTRTPIETKDSGCSKSGNGFEDRLPCEGNAALRPYGALNVGLTFGSESLGIISPGLSFGLARTAQDPTAQPFFGFLLGVGQVVKTITLKK